MIRDDVIVAARCSIPFSKEVHFNEAETGMRHKAAMTHSMEYDSIVIVVSEETHMISVAENGTLIRALTRESLTNFLNKTLIVQKNVEENLFKRLYKRR